MHCRTINLKIHNLFSKLYQVSSLFLFFRNLDFYILLFAGELSCPAETDLGCAFPNLGYACVDASYVCDYQLDCWGLEDEIGCGTLCNVADNT